MNSQSAVGRPAPAWYLVHVRPRKEQQVAQLLNERLDVGVYLPLVRQHHHGKVQASPFFPCYLFVRADLQRTALSAINATPGVVKLVSCADVPIRLTDDLVGELRYRVDELNERGGVANHRLIPGVAIRLRSGPLRGMEGAFVGPTSPSLRVRVLLEFMGSMRETEVPAAAVEPIGSAPAAQRPRRTRGGGRYIV